MKKIIILAVLFSPVFSFSVFAQTLPTTADVTFSVLNVSQENKDAQQIGANNGDVLRYEILISSDEEDVVNYITTVDLTNLLEATEIIDTGFGELTGTQLGFPAFSQTVPCEKSFSFFVRVKPCDGNASVEVSVNGKTTKVMLNCGLTESGSSFSWKLMVLLGVGTMIFFGFSFRRKS
ncbi:hypothetical protein KAI58_04940 [Candidatus Gracilibacteria bacterium]|nr:hypothetical protein [Candidatus Gracilibacteria bacterium]